MKNNYLSIIIFTLFTFFTANIVVAKHKDDDTPDNNYPNSYYYKQFHDAFERVQKSYVQEPDYQEMVDEAIDGMLRSMDPYMGYYTDEDFDFFMEQTDGEFGGIGVEIIPDAGVIKVITPIDDLPAYNAGIKASDYIIGVNGELVSNMGFNKAVREMRGEPGTKLNLLVIKEDEDKPKEIELKREIVRIKPVKYEIEYDDIGVIGYIRISAFNNNTTKDLKNAVNDIKKQAKSASSELRGIILDVRNNPGGLVEQAQLVSEYFIEQGTIVTAKGRNKNQDMVLTASKYSEKAPNVPIVMIINSGTASAPEIVAGALQDHNRAIILGTTSFGKGLVQTFTKVSKRAGIKITTQKYYTPSGRSINAKGIEPDIYIEQAQVKFDQKDETERKFTSSSIKKYLDKYNKDEKNDETKDDHQKSKNKIKIDKKSRKNDKNMSEKYKNDYQYARAYDLISGLILNENKKHKN